jgi:integrase
MPTAKRPTYTLHRPSGQGRCRIRGKSYYFGPFALPTSKAKYEKFIADWLAKQDPNAGQTIDDLAILFFDHAEQYYKHPDGSPTGETRNLRDAMRPLLELFGNAPIIEFGPRRLKMVRDRMIASGMCRSNVNRQIHRIRRMFSWGVENELVDPQRYAALKEVKALSQGRTEAVESEPVEPVAESAVTAVRPFLTRVLCAMVDLQLLTGARPGEICLLRPADISVRTDGTWSYRPPRHKTAWRGKERVIILGPQAQDVLRPFLDRPADSYCFSPAESELERSLIRRRMRQTPMTPSQAARPAPQRVLSDRYVKDSYGRAVRRACQLAKIDEWSPGQLRHTRATEIREKYGLEGVAAVLGHGDLKTSTIYAARNIKEAVSIMREIG